MMIQREVCQLEDTITLANLVKMSREHNIALTVCVGGREHTGFIKGAAYMGQVPMLYMRYPDTDDPEKERHVLIDLNSITDCFFTTDKGFLDNLIE